jgi:hypothetical protein
MNIKNRIIKALGGMTSVDVDRLKHKAFSEGWWAGSKLTSKDIIESAMPLDPDRPMGLIYPRMRMTEESEGESEDDNIG